ncbi:exosortase-associated protein EpsI, B-type [Methylophilus aquaticus]|uniref:EpsI family protein n=1 Tax=Methylophilus aquaticus TaxID=1971610 RepID=A0ABT9JTH1_9PROT|nr:exosortase-associated protein EpsI, B-type [Methylophilus aquaticus]MDP8567779.1 EpsI family protein [Methylophilus aquaticus]
MTLKKYILMLLMIVASIIAFSLRPTHKLAAERQHFVLEQIIPQQFGDWQMDEKSMQSIVNPQQTVLINKLYHQTLTRNYANSQGEHVMLVIAYGEDQSDNTQLHYPEVCYPAQGFQIVSKVNNVVKTPLGDIRVKQLVATLSNRVEPITYWTTIGDKVVVGAKETKLEKLKYGFKGDVPDGILLRVSTINQTSQNAYALQSEFINALLSAVNHNYTKQIFGLSDVVHN